ncbi:CRISPR-associated protein Cas4 [Streptomyces johnsoniae]|uniref:CRISPR-associated exonuclease Cas4 n=1 Tax=Streptomyces johnsoniae TaxID=3075532 RepID=A0ABU2S924_9ACTN|nr:CRISPR-associated protein Cas4 [Streptomyces sp. DSM 41886]MDT0444299.1 CRISPR-associated protein Cas4 [Streptomyces sp. DSM 41886]
MITDHRAASREGGPLQVPLSALEHFAYCPRQSGLILLEDAFEDDAATVRGTLLHQRVDTPGNRGRGSVRTLHALPVWNDALGLVGICDAVELHADGRILPVEHKSGRYRPGGPADLQTAGQAMCLEAMFHTTIEQAAIYSAADRRRHLITVNTALREQVANVTEAVRRMLTSESLPPPVADGRCRRCSMANSCMPRILADDRSYRQALRDLYRIAPEPENA